MELLPLAFTSGWASGINAYATVLVLGLLGKFAGFAQIPDALQRTDVLIVMAVLAVLELLADKIPYLDSAWDAISTIVRPIAGGLIGALIGGAQGDLWTVLLAAVGGVTALLSHAVKGGIRLAVNSSPEPASNIAISVVEDVAVVVVVVGALLFPIVATVLAGVLLLAGVGVVFLVAKRIRTTWQWVRRWRTQRRTEVAQQKLDRKERLRSAPRSALRFVSRLSRRKDRP